ncbi:MAG: hypothetical protein RMJ53_03795, partial [Chitinophagales bacterium]|nr:hypothetical protein [Chitinophagales bacterium]MDW8273337.1 hypothetical protein [Chitinophagales bacterium]
MKKEEIRDELKQIAPNMPLPGNTSFFTLPDNYFSSAQQQIFQKIKLEEQWKNAADPALSPVLSQMKHSKAFSMPENYFSES